MGESLWTAEERQLFKIGNRPLYNILEQMDVSKEKNETLYNSGNANGGEIKQGPDMKFPENSPEYSVMKGEQ